ncbi:MAG: hypothetical protein GSR80_001654 [Desulfurococcales archaeon]|nr:hypothetical protein [Desulfurococcales archaeon]
MHSMGVASLGYSTVEDIPLFHVAPGGSALRVVLPAQARLPGGLSCPGWCGILGELTRAAGSEEAVQVPVGDIVSLARRWRVDVVSIEGVEPALDDQLGELASKARSSGLTVAVRTQGLAPPDSLIDSADVIIFDYITLIDDPAYKVSATTSLEGLASSGLLAEVNVYIDEPLVETLTPVLHSLSRNTVLHLHIGNPRGGGAARQLYDIARKRVPYTYLHAPPYDRLETYCHECGALVAVREASRLVALKAPGGRCWRCGAKLPLRGPLYEATRATILRRSGGGTVWHDPRVLVGATRNS